MKPKFNIEESVLNTVEFLKKMNGYLKREMNKIVLITGGTRGLDFR